MFEATFINFSKTYARKFDRYDQAETWLYKRLMGCKRFVVGNISAGGEVLKRFSRSGGPVTVEYCNGHTLTMEGL